MLGRPAGRDLQALVDLAARLCDVSGAAINLISGTLQHQIAATGFDASVCERDDSMCATVLDESAVVVVPDASLDPRFSKNPFVTGEIGDVRFYASAALRSPGGIIIGRLCVFDRMSRRITSEQHASLEVLAEQVSDVLELRLRSRQLEESLAELTRTQDELRRSNEHLLLFAAQVSHDLQNPLTAILANTELLGMQPAIVSDGSLAELVDATFDAGQRMDALMQGVLEFAQVGGLLEFAATDLDSLLAAALSDLRPAITASGAQIKSDPLPMVLGDGVQLYSVLLNLLSNAIKFSRPDVPPRIDVGVEHLDGQRCRVWVTDNGVGVSAKAREEVFLLFARADRTLPGRGIGLATAKRIIDSHGGKIGIDEAPGGGTTVWFELKLAPLSGARLHPDQLGRSQAVRSV